MSTEVVYYEEDAARGARVENSYSKFKSIMSCLKRIAFEVIFSNLEMDHIEYIIVLV